MSDALKQLAASAEPLYVVVVADDGGDWGDGQPIAMETALAHGATYIAECRILPSTLREPRQ